jgi:hypothetical protein
MKPTLCLDFDGVLHSYTSGWKGPRTIPDLPTTGAMEFLWTATEYFTVAILSSRSHKWFGRYAMKQWLKKYFYGFHGHDTISDDKFNEIQWPLHKPSAFITIDDRALTFDGNWDHFHPLGLQQFKPWNYRYKL